MWRFSRLAPGQLAARLQAGVAVLWRVQLGIVGNLSVGPVATADREQGGMAIERDPNQRVVSPRGRGPGLPGVAPWVVGVGFEPAARADDYEELTSQRRSNGGPGRGQRSEGGPGVRRRIVDIEGGGGVRACVDEAARHVELAAHDP